MGTKAALDEVLLLLLRVVLPALGVDDGCVRVGRVVSAFGFVGEVRACKGSGACVTAEKLPQPWLCRAGAPGPRARTRAAAATARSTRSPGPTSPKRDRVSLSAASHMENQSGHSYSPPRKPTNTSKTVLYTLYLKETNLPSLLSLSLNVL